MDKIRDIPMAIGISRVTNGDRGYIKITIEDRDASISFLKFEVSMENFALAVTGLHGVEGLGEVRNLQNVGKKLELNKNFEFELPEKAIRYGDNKEIAQKEVKKVCPKGWTPDMGFNSQHTFFTNDDGKEYARTTLRRWVEKE